MTPTDQRIRSRIQGFRRGSKRVKDSTIFGVANYPGCGKIGEAGTFA